MMGKLELHRNLLLLYKFIVLLCLSGSLRDVEGVGMVPFLENFGNFTDHLVHILETSEPTEHRPGVHLYTPFSIGYLMANVYESLWPVPVKEVPEAIFTLRKYVATDYAALLRLFKKRQFRVSSTIYSSFGNVTKPPTFPQLLTQVISLDLQKNRTEFRDSMKEILERGTKGHLENEMLPKKDRTWKEIFDDTTHGVYVNTFYYKSEWDKPWREIGERSFYDNARVPFIEMSGEFPYAETENASAVIIYFQASTKQIVLFKPNDFTSVTDMRRIVRTMLNDESLWKKRNVTVQMPALNVTNLSQPSDKFPFLGVMDTFCRGRFMDPALFYYNQHPIAHANHFEFSTNYLEVSSSSGSLVAYQNNKDFLPKPPANQTQHEVGTTSDVDYFDILEATEEEDERYQDYIVDARSNLPGIKQYRRGKDVLRRVNVKNLNTSKDNYEFEECDPALASSEEMMADFARSGMAGVTDQTPSNPTGSPMNDTMDGDKEELTTLSPPPPSSTTSEKPMKPLKPMVPDDGTRILVLDTPFSWILRDKEIGEVFYGSVSSLCQYNRAVKHIPSVPVWVIDLFKAFYWRCV